MSTAKVKYENKIPKKIYDTRRLFSLDDRCKGDIVNKFEQVLGGGCSQESKFEQAHAVTWGSQTY